MGTTFEIWQIIIEISYFWKKFQSIFWENMEELSRNREKCYEIKRKLKGGILDRESFQEVAKHLKLFYKVSADFIAIFGKIYRNIYWNVEELREFQENSWKHLLTRPNLVFVFWYLRQSHPSVAYFLKGKKLPKSRSFSTYKKISYDCFHIVKVMLIINRKMLETMEIFRCGTYTILILYCLTSVVSRPFDLVSKMKFFDTAFKVLQTVRALTLLRVG